MLRNQYNLEIFNEMSEKYLIANIINLVFTSAPNEAGSYKFNLQCMNTRGKCGKKQYRLNLSGEQNYNREDLLTPYYKYCMLNYVFQ